MAITPSIPGVNILVHINGNLVTSQSGFLGVLVSGTKITITLEVPNPKVEHQCYTLATKHGANTVRTPKAAQTNGVYVKNLTVIEKRTSGDTITTQVAGWPNNMFCLDIQGKIYNIGITSQNGRYLLVIEEYTPPIEVNELTPIGMVLSSSPLRGTAAINIGSALFNARLHWSNMPFRLDLGFRHLNQGEVIDFNAADVTKLDGASSFRYEIKHCSLA